MIRIMTKAVARLCVLTLFILFIAPEVSFAKSSAGQEVLSLVNNEQKTQATEALSPQELQERNESITNVVESKNDQIILASTQKSSDKKDKKPAAPALQPIPLPTPVPTPVPVTAPVIAPVPAPPVSPPNQVAAKKKNKGHTPTPPVSQPVPVPVPPTPQPTPPPVVVAPLPPVLSPNPSFPTSTPNLSSISGAIVVPPGPGQNYRLFIYKVSDGYHATIGVHKEYFSNGSLVMEFSAIALEAGYVFTESRVNGSPSGGNGAFASSSGGRAKLNNMIALAQDALSRTGNSQISSILSELRRF